MATDSLPSLIQAVPSLLVGFSTAAVALYAARAANSYRRQLDLRTSDRRFEAYARLWEITADASPHRRSSMTKSERLDLYESIASGWYYQNGNGMLLAYATREVYLRCIENLRCADDELYPSSLVGEMPEDAAAREEWRGRLSQDQFSLLRTQMKTDLAIIGRIFRGALTQRDIEFLQACEINTSREPWTKSPRSA
jgi:hypothetical protein